VIDVVRYGQSGPAPDPPVGATTSRWHDGREYTDCWTTDLTQTLFARNDGPGCGVPPELVLNEVLYDATNPSDRFVELHYTGSGSLDITGYRIQGNSMLTIATGPVLTAARRQALIRNDDSASAALLFDGLLLGGDNLYLYRPTGTGALLDEVGWSQAHPRDTSLCRASAGEGANDGYDDASSLAAGWRFGCVPDPAAVVIGPDQTRVGYFGDALRFDLTVTNQQTQADTIDITFTSEPSGWVVALRDASGLLALPDTDGDLVPDVGNLPPNGQANLTAFLTLPATPQPIESAWVNVTATASRPPFARGVAALVGSLHPHLTVAKRLSPAVVNVAGAGWGERATLTLEVTARGEPVPAPRPMDVVLVIGSGRSLVVNDSLNTRLAAARYFIGLLSAPDRVSVLDFDGDCTWTRANVGGVEHHLSSPGHGGSPDYSDPVADVDTIDSSGGTNILCALLEATQELTSLGDPGHHRVLVLLSDGERGPRDPLLDAARAAAEAGVLLFVIGLGVDPELALLEQIAAAADGMFYRAPSPSVLEDIHARVRASALNLTALDPYDPASFPEEMVKEVLPPYITVVPSSFSLPAENNVEVNPAPDTVAGNTLQWKVPRIRLDQTWAVSFELTCSQGGTHPVDVVPDSRVAYVDWTRTRRIVPFPALDVACLVGAVIGPPTDIVTRWLGGGSIGLAWTPSLPLPDHYLVYKTTDGPDGFPDFRPSAAYDRVPATNTSWTDPESIGAATEYYYLLRSANAAETDISGTSNTAGVFAGHLDAGVTAISRPLAYFPSVDYSGPEEDTLGEYRVAFGAQWIEYMDGSGRWRRVTDPSDATALEVGKAYVVGRATAGRFVFTGLPGSHILYDDGPSPGFEPATTARSLRASVAGDDVVLTWDAVPGVTSYEILFATGRLGFSDGFAVPLAPTTLLTYTHAGALVLGNELYYLVRPAGGAASTYSIGVWTATYAGHGTFGLPLRPAAGSLRVSDFARVVPNALGVLWLAPNGEWVPHFTGMPPGVYDVAVSPGAGYQIVVGASVRYSFVGR